MLDRYGGYRGNKIPGADQNQYRSIAVDRGICKGWRKKTSKTEITWSSRLGVVRMASYPSMENICKLKTLNEGMKPDGLTLRSLTLYIYGAPILDVSRSHTTTQHSR